jgi:hypothetical protein
MYFYPRKGKPQTRPARTLGDRIVAVAFCGCLLLFLHALAGLGETTSPNRLLMLGSRLLSGIKGKSRKTPTGDEGGHSIIRVDTHELDKVATIATILNPILTSIFATSQPMQNGATAEDFRFGHRLYGTRADPFDLDPFFDLDEYNSDDQPFALKIRVQGSGIVPKSGERCQASGGLRCQD